MTIDEGVIEGKFPKRALKHVLEWLDLHHEELLVNWHHCQQREPLKDIAPLELTLVILHITDAKHLQDYKVWLKFNDDLEDIVDLSKELWGSMFEPLKDLSLFSQVRLDSELDTITWPNGADLAPEFLYGLLQQSQ